MDESTSKSFVSDIAWVCRGIAKHVPEKVEIEKEVLKDLLQGEGIGSSDEESLHAEENNSEERQGLRGSASDLTEGLLKYKLDDYDDVDMAEDAKKGPSLKGLAYYTSPLDDPYITRHADSDEEEEKEDFNSKTLTIWLLWRKLSRKRRHWKSTHTMKKMMTDYILEAPPLCLAPFSYDPGAEDKKGNLVAVGTMDSVIHVWDLDIVNAMEPVLSLGQSSVRASKKSKKSKSLSEEPSGSKNFVSGLESSCGPHFGLGSADASVILWDLDEAKPATIVPDFKGMVQSLRWHPVEQSIILAGTRKGQINVIDCRSSDTQSSSLSWSIGKEFEVEKVLWDRFNPFCAFTCSSDGKLRYFDTRKPGDFVSEISAHGSGVNDVSQSFKVKGLLTTVGANEFKVWKLGNEGQLKHVYTHQVNMGTVNIGKFCPDSGNIMAMSYTAEEKSQAVEWFIEAGKNVTDFGVRGAIDDYRSRLERCLAVNGRSVEQQYDDEY
uniref:Uncharacterized protein n=1 Tax=Ditylenchus dipsaci TaxID=166011 RepID=A0A915DMX2_9BILA